MKSNFLDKIIEQFRFYLLVQKSLSKNTANSYIRDINIFFNSLLNVFNSLSINNINDFKKINTSTVRSFIVYDKKQASSNETVNRRISSMRKFFIFLEQEHEIQNDSFFTIKKAKVGKKIPRAINSEKMLDIIENIQKYIDPLNTMAKWQILRDKSILFIMFLFGLRISELLSLKKAILKDRNLRVIGKGNKERILEKNPIINKILNEYLQACPYTIRDEDYLFISNTGKKYYPRQIQKNVEKIRINAGLPEYFTPHAIRHSCATCLLEQGGSIKTIQEILGHKSITSTEIYLNITNKKIESDLKKIKYYDK